MVGDGSPDRRFDLVGGGLAEAMLKDMVNYPVCWGCHRSSQSREDSFLSLFLVGSDPGTSKSGLNVGHFQGILTTHESEAHTKLHQES